MNCTQHLNGLAAVQFSIPHVVEVTNVDARKEIWTYVFV